MTLTTNFLFFGGEVLGSLFHLSSLLITQQNSISLITIWLVQYLSWYNEIPSLHTVPAATNSRRLQGRSRRKRLYNLHRWPRRHWSHLRPNHLRSESGSDLQLQSSRCAHLDLGTRRIRKIGGVLCLLSFAQGRFPHLEAQRMQWQWRGFSTLFYDSACRVFHGGK